MVVLLVLIQVLELFLLEGPDVEPAPPLPTITLTASPTSVTIGDTTTLTWNTPNFDISKLSFFAWDLQPYSGVVGRSGSANVTVSNTTTYIYTVTRRA